MSKSKNNKKNSSHNNSSNSQNKSKRIPKNNIIGFVILFTLLGIFLLLVIISYLIVKKHYVFSVVTFTIIAGINALFLFVFRNAFKKLINFFKCILNNPDKNKKIPKIHILSWLSGILALFIVLTSVPGSVIAATVTIKHTNTSTKANNINDSANTVNKTVEIPYDFSTVTNEKIWKDLYFLNETDENTFVDNLEKSLRNIQAIKRVSDEELNIAHNYGDIALDAVDHQKLLKTLINNSSKYIAFGPLPKECYQHIIEVRKIMDTAMVTPNNRHEIMNVYSFGAEKELFEETKVIEYEKALRYAWGTVYIVIAWNDWDNWDNEGTTYDCIQDLQDIYRFISELNVQNNNQIEFIINSLERLKKRFAIDSPTPIIQKNEITYNYLYGHTEK